jgi:hypothetical protein
MSSLSRLEKPEDAHDTRLTPCSPPAPSDPRECPGHPTVKTPVDPGSIPNFGRGALLHGDLPVSAGAGKRHGTGGKRQLASCGRQRSAAKEPPVRFWTLIFCRSPKLDGYFAFMYRGEMCFASVPFVSSATSFPGGAPVTAGRTSAFFVRSPGLGTPGHRGWGDPWVACRWLRPRHPPV